MFPFSVQIKKVIHSNKAGSFVVDHLESFILENDGTIEKRSDDYIKFKTSLIVWNWKQFSLIDKGAFTVNNQMIVFRFTMYKLFIVASILSLLAFIATKSLNISLIAFALFGIGNWFVSIYRCYGALEKITNDLSNQ